MLWDDWLHKKIYLYITLVNSDEVMIAINSSSRLVCLHEPSVIIDNGILSLFSCYQLAYQQCGNVVILPCLAIQFVIRTLWCACLAAPLL